MEKLALLGGEPVIQEKPQSLFAWPIMTDEDKAAAMDVVENNCYCLRPYQ